MGDTGSHLFYKTFELVDVELHGFERYSSPYFAHNASTSRQLNHEIADLLGNIFQMWIEIVIRYFDILLLSFHEFEGDKIYAAVVVELFHFLENEVGLCLYLIKPSE